MSNFKDFNIKPAIKNFEGEKIKITRILNTLILVLDYKIEDSKVNEGTKFLTLHIERQEIRHVVFTGAVVLIQEIEQVPKAAFPFKTTIVKDHDYYEFT